MNTNEDNIENLESELTKTTKINQIIKGYSKETVKEKISELADYSLLFNEKTGQLELKEWRCEGQKKLTISQMIEKNVKEKLKQKFNENPSLAQDPKKLLTEFIFGKKLKYIKKR